MSKSSIAKKVRAFKFGQLVMTELGINYTTITAIELKAMTEDELVCELERMAIYLHEQNQLFINMYLSDSIPIEEQKESHMKIAPAIKYINFCLKVK